eukprot:TRINITY_DN3291_c0_g1_i1.p1 TRINITY_DN3291_c0_g1~~TRINITY_DN3291_c0_g1_i1.p1  ORF type:complete len:639 (+),score=193.45 TRINITY_DN3291_c0_g1_i1:19-1935(+)
MSNSFPVSFPDLSGLRGESERIAQEMAQMARSGVTAGAALAKVGMKKMMGFAKSAAEKAKDVNLSSVPPLNIGGRIFSVKKLLSSAGRFGQVFLVKDESSQELFALKQMQIFDQASKAAIQKEFSIWQALSGHENVVNLVAASVQGNQANAVMDLCPGGSMLDQLNKPQGNQLSEKEVLVAFLDICKAVDHLHSRTPPIIHRDIKIENMLLAENGTWKLCDFGSCTTDVVKPQSERERMVVEEDISKNTTMCYRAPEMVDLHRDWPIDTKSDIWALGCLLFKIAYGTDAFEGPLGIVNGKFFFPRTIRFSPEFQQLISNMFVVEPSKRMDISEVIAQVCKLANIAPIQAKFNAQVAAESSAAALAAAAAAKAAESANKTKSVKAFLFGGDDESTPAQDSPSQDTAPAPAVATPVAQPVAQPQLFGDSPFFDSQPAPSTAAQQSFGNPLFDSPAQPQPQPTPSKSPVAGGNPLFGSTSNAATSQPTQPNTADLLFGGPSASPNASSGDFFGSTSQSPMKSSGGMSLGSSASNPPKSFLPTDLFDFSIPSSSPSPAQVPAAAPVAAPVAAQAFDFGSSSSDFFGTPSAQPPQQPKQDKDFAALFGGEPVPFTQQTAPAAAQQPDRKDFWRTQQKQTLFDL